MYTIGFLLFAFANRGWMMFAFMVPFSLGGFAGPALQGIISNQVPDNEQGELQGSLTSLIAVTSIIGPLTMTWLFAWFTSEAAPVHFAGAPFFMGAVLCLVSLLLAVRTLRKYGRRGEV
jgi:MFS transporter, DHA1 family, tetracycline resistance protein